MIGMSLADAAAIVGGQLTGADHGFEGVSTDSRTLAPKQLFYALKGERFDGHDSLPQAADRGAAGAVVTRRMDTALACIHVPDTRRALGDLARAWRLRHHCTVIGVTGSNGKTTTKEMTAAILRQRGPTLATEGNLNNHIGLPLTLFGLSAEHEAAVIEMGANAMNDIAELADIARPDIGIVTMCGPAHLQGFGSVENVALAKGRLFEGIAPEGVAILNVDDPFRDFWLTMCGQRKVLRFGLSAEADFTAHEITEGAPGEGVRFELVCPQGTVTIHLPVDGVHNVRNALAAAAASMAAGATLSEVATGLAGMDAVRGLSMTATTPIPPHSARRCMSSGGRKAGAGWCWGIWANWGRRPRRFIAPWAVRPANSVWRRYSRWANSHAKRSKASDPAPGTSRM